MVNIKGIILITVLVSCLQLGTFAEKKKETSYAQQNEFLREYFLPLCYHKGVGSSSYEHWGRRVDIPSTGGTNRVFLKQCVDNLIDRFVSDIYEKLNQLKFNSQKIQLTQNRCLEQQATETQTLNGSFLKDEFKQIRKLSDDIYGDLRGLFPFLKNEEEFNLLVPEESKNSCFKDEIHLLRLHLELADQQVRGFFSGPQLVHANQLNSNMIITLFRTREIAALMEKQ